MVSKEVNGTQEILHKGRQRVQNDLISQHTPLVKRIAFHLINHLPKFIQPDDLLQAGLIGLLEASRNYDSDKGASFTTYASIRIRGAMLDEVRKNDWLPRSVYRNARLIADATKVVENRKGGDAKGSEVAAELGISLVEFQRMRRDTQLNQFYSFDECNVNELEITGELEEPLVSVQRADFCKRLTQAIKSLPERDRQVMAFYYDENLNLKQIGALLGITESRVCQIRHQAMQKIQSRLPTDS